MKPVPKSVFSVLAIALALFAGQSVALPEVVGKASGKGTLIAIERTLGRQVASTVVGLAGFYGQDQPAQWLVLARDPKARNLLHEYAMTNGKIVAQRHFSSMADWDIPNIPIRLATIKVDSPQAFAIAERNARMANIGFDSVHYQLRCRDLRHEPVWMLNMVDQKQNSVGVQYISAITGETLRTVWHRPGTPEYAEVNQRPGLITNLGKTLDEAGKTITSATKSIAQKVVPGSPAKNSAPVPRPQYQPTQTRPVTGVQPPRGYQLQRRAVQPVTRR